MSAQMAPDERFNVRGTTQPATDRGRPLIVGIGGTSHPNSSTERVLALALDEAQKLGASTRLFGGDFLMRLPLYITDRNSRTAEELEMIEAIRRAHGLIIATPGYHGGMSGVVKNALDLIEDTSRDARAYLDGVAVGLIVVAGGWQAAGTTLSSMRATVHALRGWPTPFGAAINSAGGLFGPDGQLADPQVQVPIRTVAAQVVEFVRWREAGVRKDSN